MTFIQVRHNSDVDRREISATTEIQSIKCLNRTRMNYRGT